jgi:hypothetical protein
MLYTRPLHRFPIDAPVKLIRGCVGWFLETVVAQILNLGCRLKMVVGFEFYSSGCTSYLGYLPLVTMPMFSATYPWRFVSHIVKIRTTYVSLVGVDEDCNQRELRLYAPLIGNQVPDHHAG